MDFMSAVKNGFHQYATFSGRARRSEYWFWQLFTFLVSLGVSILSAADGMNADGTPRGGIFSALGGLVTLALLLPSLSVLVRRLHDTGRSAWHVLYWGVLPGVLAFPLLIAGFVMLYNGAMDGSGQSHSSVVFGLLAMGFASLLVMGFGTVLLVFTVLDSRSDNKYGPSPKGVRASEPDAQETV